MKRVDILAIVLLALVIVAFFYKTIFFGLVPIPGDLLVAEYGPWKTYAYNGYVPGSYPNKAQYFDVLRQLYPWKTLSVQTLKEGNLPLWNPYNFSGSPLMSNFQSAIFYPLNVFYFFLPQITAWSILVFLQPMLACLFMYFYARKIGISILGSFFASLSFSFSSFMTVWLEYNTMGHVILWLPLVLLSVEHLFKKITAWWMLAFVLSLSFSLFGGHPQIFAYLFIFITFYIIYRARTLKKSSRFLFLLSFLPLGIGAIQLVSGMELIFQSARISHEYGILINKILIQPWQLSMLFVPDFFGNPATRNYIISDTYIGKVTSIGLVPLFFVSLLIIRKTCLPARQENEMTKFFGASCVVILLLATANPFTQLAYKFTIPFFSSSAPTLAVFLFCFSLSILSGFGIDVWQNEKMSGKKFIFWIAPIAFIFILLWISTLLFPKLSSRNLLYGTMIFSATLFLLLVGTLKTKMKFVILIFLIVLQTVDLFYAFQKFNPFSPSTLIFPYASVLEFLKKETGINRFWGYGSAQIEANFATQEFLFSPDGYDPLYSKRYGEFIQSSKNGKIETVFTGQTRSDAFIAPGSKEEDVSTNPYRLKVLDSLGVKYILDRIENNSTEKTFPQDRFRLVYNADSWKIFENLKVSPRVFLTSNYRIFKSKEEFNTLFFSKDFNASKTILLEENPEGGVGQGRFNDLNHFSKVQIQSYMPNKIILTTDTNTNQLLFLSDTYYPGWKAFIDPTTNAGQGETKIYRADYAFRSIIVPVGKHTIVFTYDSISFKIGFSVTVVSMVMTIFIFVSLLRSERKL